MIKARCDSYSHWFRQGLTDLRDLVMISKEEGREMGASKSAEILRVLSEGIER